MIMVYVAIALLVVVVIADMACITDALTEIGKIIVKLNIKPSLFNSDISEITAEWSATTLEPWGW